MSKDAVSPKYVEVKKELCFYVYCTYMWWCYKLETAVSNSQK